MTPSDAIKQRYSLTKAQIAQIEAEFDDISKRFHAETGIHLCLQASFIADTETGHVHACCENPKSTFFYACLMCGALDLFVVNCSEIIGGSFGLAAAFAVSSFKKIINMEALDGTSRETINHAH